MSQDSHDNDIPHAVRRIVLPSGREIEVISFCNGETDAHQLHICPDCESDLVQPVAWNEASDGSWELELRCPNCAWTETGVYSRGQVEQLEEKLDEGLTSMITDLHRLTHANMAEDVDRFIAALQADLVLPEDF